MKYDVVIVGGGVAGLTSAAYAAKYGYKVLVCEQQGKVGGLVNSFEYKGFILDGGIRALENSGIVFPMLKQLGIEMEFTKNAVSIMVGDKEILLTSNESLIEYEQFLIQLFPDNQHDIESIIMEIKRVIKYMDVLYGIDNPLFVDYQKDMNYITKTILPWLVKYLFTIGKIEKLNEPIDEYLKRFTSNQALIDVIAQHFFYKTPAFFALSYFSLYLDYNYPIGGTGVLPQKMTEFIIENGGVIKTNCKINKIDLSKKELYDSEGDIFGYNKIIWAADCKALYDIVAIETAESIEVQNKIKNMKNRITGKKGGDSIFTVYITIAEKVERIKKQMNAHVFFTPLKKGLSSIRNTQLKEKIQGENCSVKKEEILCWVEEYLEKNTFEISCPAMRDAALAPEGKTGLIVSFLFDYTIIKYIKQIEFYEEFKQIVEKKVCQIIMETLLKEHQDKVIETFSSTPLTLEGLTGNLEGAITGWAFTNKPLPAVSKLSKVADSVKTPISDIFQAGQWTFSPSGLPISIMTGKLAMDAIRKKH